MMSRTLALLASASLAACACAEQVLVEAEGYAAADDSLVAPYVSTRDGTSGGRIAGVRRADTGGATWLDYPVTVEGGLYELFIRAGGNNSRQAAMVSIDGGKPVTVLDDPPSALPLGGPLPADYAERSRYLEQSFREHLLGSVELAAGQHRVRVEHAGLENRSNSFGFDWLKLISVEASDAPSMEVGDLPEVVRRVTEREPLELRVLTSYRFWGPDETPRYALMVLNRAMDRPVTGKLTLDLVSADSGRTVRSLVRDQVTALATGEGLARLLDLGVLQAPRGRYRIVARLEIEGGETLTDEAEVTLVDLSTPGWAKRARTKWARYNLGMDLDRALASLTGTIQAGINVVVNANTQDFFAGEAVSYPFRGRDEDFRRFLDTAHELGACQLMYHTMITVGEHFYYEHRDFWGARKPFYHCSWLSIYPDSPQWNRLQADDFEYFIRKFPLDGIFLDNASAGGWPDARTEAGEEAIAHHQETVRAAIKRANPTGVLYPNYNTMSPDGLRVVARAFDAHMLEGAYPVPEQHSEGNGWRVRKFVEVASRIRQTTGKPFWPLMYMPSQYQKLCIAACGAARANPCGPVDHQYLHFMGDLQEYLYADDVFPAPQGTVTLAPEDSDLAATALVKMYAGSAAQAGVRDWIIQIVNGAEEDGRPAEREVELTLDLPSGDLLPDAWVLRPEAGVEKIALTNPLKLRVGIWTVLVIADELLPVVRISPALIAPVPGEPFPLEVRLEARAGVPAERQVELVGPPEWSSGESFPVRERGKARLTLRPPRDAVPGNRELLVRVTWGQRIMDFPVLARVQPRLEVTLRRDHFAVLKNTSGNARLVVTNRTGEAVGGMVRLRAPQGWQVTPESAQVEVPAGETATVPCRLTWPEFRPASLYDLRDGDLRVSLQAAAERVTETIPVRLHMPPTWALYCPLGTRPADVIRTGATPGGGMLSDLLFTVRGYPRYLDDARAAVERGLSLQQAGEQGLVLWFRASGENNGSLATPEVAGKLAEFMAMGGGVVLQENLFRDSEASRVLLETEVCPIGPPYLVTDVPGGDWSVTEPAHGAIRRFATQVLQGESAWGLPVHAQPTAVKFTVKPWAEVVARNALGDPVVVVSGDPRRPVAYLAGSLEGTYLDNRYGTGDYPDQMADVLCFYAELARWLSVFGAQAP